MRYLIFIVFFLFLTQIQAQCNGAEPEIDLGADHILCAGNIVPLKVGGDPSFDFYSWSNGAMTDSILISAPDLYILNACKLNGNQNLVQNGDFEMGNTGFTSAYNYIAVSGGQALNAQGSYAIDTNANDYLSTYCLCGDHTSGFGKYYIAKGASSLNDYVWRQTINVQANTDYQFSAWVVSLVDSSSAKLQFFVNGIQLGNVIQPEVSSGAWKQFYELWNSGASTTIDVAILNKNSTNNKNDFGIDDVSFTPICVKRDTINVTILSVDAGLDAKYCENQEVYLSGSVNNNKAQMYWEYNSVATTGNSIHAIASGDYYLYATLAGLSCKAEDHVHITMKPSPKASFLVKYPIQLVPYTNVFTNTSSGATNFSWNFGNNQSQFSQLGDVVSTTYTTVDTFVVQLIALDPDVINNCPDTTYLTVIGADYSSLEPTDVFTPNQDGVNDFYQFKLHNMKEVEISILSRWGELIYQLEGVNAVWDGTDKNGQTVPTGVYFYQFNAKTLDDRPINGQGFIQVFN